MKFRASNVKKSSCFNLGRDLIITENLVFSRKECPMVLEEPVVLKLLSIYLHIIKGDY